MPQSALSPDTDRRFVELALARALVDSESVRLATQRLGSDPRGRSLAELLCDAGALDRRVAAGLLREVRSGDGRRSFHVPPPVVPLRELTPSVPPPRANRIEPASLVAGSRLGSYRIVSRLGRGGMGVVFRAYDERLRREVALKTLHDVGDQDAAERFVREARAAAKLHHPGIVAVHDAGVVDGVPFMALELIEGTTLGERIASGGPLPPEKAASLVRDVALAVEEAHKAGVIHRDLKPANVLLDREQRPRLTDFGLARDSEATAITASGDTLGTPAYMAPEQALSHTPAIGPRTDVYGLGAVLYAALAGRPPFEGPSGMAVMRKVIEDDPESPTSVRVARGLAPVPRELELVCLKCLEKSPARRYASAEDLASELGRYLAGEPVVVRPLGLVARGVRRLRRSRGLLALVLALAAVAGTGATSFFVLRAREERARAELRRVDLESLQRLRAEAVAAIDSFREMASVLTYDDRASGEGGHAADVTISRGMRALLVTSDFEGRREVLEVPARPGDPDLTALVLAVKDASYVVDDWEVALSALEMVVSHGRGSGPAPVVDALRRVQSDVAWSRDPALGQRVETIWHRTAVLRNDERWEEIVRALEEAIAIDSAPPRFAELRATRALGMLRGGDAVSAAALATEALELQPRFAGAHLLRANCRLALKDAAGALEDADAALRLRPGMPGAHIARGAALVKLDRFDEGASELAAIAKEGNSDAQIRLIQLERGRRRLDVALSLCDEGIREFPSLAPLWELRGELLFNKRRTREAASDFQRALQLPGSPNVALLNLGKCYIELDQPDLAASCLRQFLVREPHFAGAEAIRAQLQELERKPH